MKNLSCRVVKLSNKAKWVLTVSNIYIEMNLFIKFRCRPRLHLKISENPKYRNIQNPKYRSRSENEIFNIEIWNLGIQIWAIPPGSLTKLLPK